MKTLLLITAILFSALVINAQRVIILSYPEMANDDKIDTTIANDGDTIQAVDYMFVEVPDATVAKFSKPDKDGLIISYLTNNEGKLEYVRIRTIQPVYGYGNLYLYKGQDSAKITFKFREVIKPKKIMKSSSNESPNYSMNVKRTEINQIIKIRTENSILKTAYIIEDGKRHKISIKKRSRAYSIITVPISVKKIEIEIIKKRKSYTIVAELNLGNSPMKEHKIPYVKKKNISFYDVYPKEKKKQISKFYFLEEGKMQKASMLDTGRLYYLQIPKKQFGREILLFEPDTTGYRTLGYQAGISSKRGLGVKDYNTVKMNTKDYYTVKVRFNKPGIHSLLFAKMHKGKLVEKTYEMIKVGQSKKKKSIGKPKFKFKK